MPSVLHLLRALVASTIQNKAPTKANLATVTVFFATATAVGAFRVEVKARIAALRIFALIILHRASFLDTA